VQLSRSSTVLTWDATLFSDILNSFRKFAQSLNFTASTKPNQHKTRLRLIKIIWQLGRICFSVLFNFFFWSRFSQHDRTVTLFQKRHSAHARSPLQLPLSHMRFLTRHILTNPCPIRIFSYVSGFVRSLHGNKMPQIIGDCEQSRGVFHSNKISGLNFQNFRMPNRTLFIS